jgi:hypothetical protein
VGCQNGGGFLRNSVDRLAIEIESGITSRSQCMKQKSKYLVTILLISLLSHFGFAVDKKFIDGSDKIEPTPAASEFLTKYTQAINSKSEKALVALFEPASLDCYTKSKHPDYYKIEIDRMLNNKITSLKELRKFKTTFEIHKMMNYPQSPTHLAIFNEEGPVGSRMGTGYQSIEMIEKNGKFFLAYRCL